MSTAAPTNAPPESYAVARDRRRRAIEESDMPDSTRHLLGMIQEHSDEELDRFDRGFDALRGAIMFAVKIVVGITAPVFVLLLVSMYLVAQSAGVDVDKTTHAVVPLADAVRGSGGASAAGSDDESGASEPVAAPPQDP